MIKRLRLSSSSRGVPHCVSLVAQIEEQKCHSSPQIPPQLSASWLTPHLTLCLPQDSRLVAGAVIRPWCVCVCVNPFCRYTVLKMPQAELCHATFIDLKQNGLFRKYNLSLPSCTSTDVGARENHNRNQFFLWARKIYRKCKAGRQLANKDPPPPP